MQSKLAKIRLIGCKNCNIELDKIIPGLFSEPKCLKNSISRYFWVDEINNDRYVRWE